MKIYNKLTKEILNDIDFRRMHLDKSFPENLDLATLSEFDCVPLLNSSQPHITDYQLCVGDGVVQDEYGNYLQSWKIIDITDAQLISKIDADKAETERTLKKAQREANVKNILVIVNGKEFNGDETSQTRISRALIALEFAKQDSTKWILANNEEAIVTKAELAQALILAGQKQTELWPI